MNYHVDMYPHPAMNRINMNELTFNASEENIPNNAVMLRQQMRVTRRPIESDSPPKM